MKTIKVFIVGSTELKEEFLTIKATANELNTDFQQKFHVTFFTHEIGNEEATYLDFIRNKADIVLVVLKDRIGKFTEKEYRTAINSYKASKGKHPKTFVFLHTYKEKTDDIRYIEKLMEDLEGEVFYKQYNDENLSYKVKECIKTYQTIMPKRTYSYYTLAVVVFLTAILLLFKKHRTYTYDDAKTAYENYRDSIIDEKEALSICSLAIKNGAIGAYYQIGVIYGNEGIKDPVKNHEQQKAFEKGDRLGSFRCSYGLGNIYYHKWEKLKDTQEDEAMKAANHARDYYKRAEEGKGEWQILDSERDTIQAKRTSLKDWEEIILLEKNRKK